MSTKEFAKRLARETVILKSYSFWKDSQFREAIKFLELGNKEQDIIFNELQVVALAYVLLFLEDKAASDKSPDRVMYANVAEYLVPGFLELMEETDISSGHLALWEKLIDSRIREYRKSMSMVLKKSVHWEVFKGQDKLLRPTWGRIVTLSLSVMQHIKKGQNPSVKNRLWKLVRHFLISFEVGLVEIFKEEDSKDLKVLN
jgi:hypothetical protein